MVQNLTLNWCGQDDQTENFPKRGHGNHLKETLKWYAENESNDHWQSESDMT